MLANFVTVLAKEIYNDRTLKHEWCGRVMDINSVFPCGVQWNIMLWSLCGSVSKYSCYFAFLFCSISDIFMAERKKCLHKGIIFNRKLRGHFFNSQSTVWLKTKSLLSSVLILTSQLCSSSKNIYIASSVLFIFPQRY